MNKTEERYAQRLEGLRLAGDIHSWRFEAFTLKLAEKRCRYTPDFAVYLPNGSIQFHEVKGFWRDDARVKLKVAATQFQEFQFVAVQLKKGDWVFEEF